MKYLILALTITFSLSSAMASVAGCEGKYKGKKLSFLARGSMSDTDDGIGYVKINGREVARFDGEEAQIRKWARKFSIRNDRGDIVEGKLNNIFNGNATLSRLVLPGEGINAKNVPVKCWMKK